MKKNISVAVGVALVLAVGFALVHKKNPALASASSALQPAPAVLRFLPEDVLTAQAGRLSSVLALSGALRALDSASVKAKVAGEVRAVLVREGEAVQAGQLLARIDERDYRARLAQAEASLKAAEGQRDIALLARDNSRALLAQQFISRNAKENNDSQYAIALANVDAARGALEVARKALIDTEVRAPLSGFVSARAVQPGEKVSPDNRLLDIVDLHVLEVEAPVPVEEVTRLHIGQTVQVRIEGLDAPLSARLARINPSTSAGSRSVMVYLRLENPEQSLRVGMFAEARLTTATAEQVLRVPQTAVQEERGQQVVYAIEGERIQRQVVQLGRSGVDETGSGSVEIRAGLKAGQRIVRNQLGQLQEGMPVRIEPVAHKE